MALFWPIEVAEGSIASEAELIVFKPLWKIFLTVRADVMDGIIPKFVAFIHIWSNFSAMFAQVFWLTICFLILGSFSGILEYHIIATNFSSYDIFIVITR
jgi:hypothetical protein